MERLPLSQGLYLEGVTAGHHHRWNPSCHCRSPLLKLHKDGQSPREIENYEGDNDFPKAGEDKDV